MFNYFRTNQIPITLQGRPHDPEEYHQGQRAARRPSGRFGKQKTWTPPLSTTAFLAKSLSDENRLRVLLSLRQGRLSVSALFLP
jgi:hypothetical protein